MKISIDTRTLKPGDIFIPIKGDKFDGHQFIDEAIRKGAKQVLDVDIGAYAKKYRKKLPATVIGVTGSAGKTTVKDMLATVLAQKFKVVRSPGNYNNEIGVPYTLLSADFDTEILIVEMAMRHLGDMRYLAQIARPSHVVITTIGKTHMELLKTQKKIAAAKAEIFLKKAVWEPANRWAFLNHAAPYFSYLEKRATSKGFRVHSFGGDDRLTQNLSAIYAVGRHFGLSNAQIQAGLSEYKPSDHRLVQYKLARGVTLIDDSYNANPDGMVYAFDYLRQFSGRKLVVLGEMLELGEISIQEHQAVLDAVKESEISCAFLVGLAWQQCFPDPALPVVMFPNRDGVVEAVKAEVKSGDTILVRGSRGLQLEHIVEELRCGLII